MLGKLGSRAGRRSNGKCRLTVMLSLAMVIVAFGGAEQPQTRPEYVVPVSAPSLSDPLPEMWGLRELHDDTDLEDLDESFVLYLTERALFKIRDKDGQVYFTGGKQLIAKEQLTESDISDHLSSYSCLCALEYESSTFAGELHIAAGAYRLTKAPSITEEESRIVRVEFEFSGEGQAEHAKLRRLVCWTTNGDTVAPLARTMPRFAKLTRKEHPGFLDPPVDDRPIQKHENAQQSQSPHRFHVLADQYVGFQGRRATNGIQIPQRLDAPELVGTAKPGLFTWLREIRSGRKVTIDYSDYYLELDPYSRRLDRQHGIYYRDPYYWP